MEARSVACVIRESGRQELIDVLEEFAADVDPAVRAAIAYAFFGDMDFGEKGRTLLEKLAKDQAFAVRLAAAPAIACYDHAADWAVPIIRRLLDDANHKVRRAAVSAALNILRTGKGNDILVPRLLKMLRSPEEDSVGRSEVIWLFGALMTDADLAGMADDQLARLVKEARKIFNQSISDSVESEGTREESSADK
jgi:HEAT repeat protein